MIPEKYIAIESVSQLHELLHDTEKPRHPLVMVIDLAMNSFKRTNENTFYRLGLYSIFCKKFSGTMRYGRSYYDFSEGSLMFTAPGQITAPAAGPPAEEGWGLFFHPDLLHGSVLGHKIRTYSFFNYESNEALHISEQEKLILLECVRNIEREYERGIDEHTQSLIQSNVELLLNYCTRFYQRQFYTRAKVSTDAIHQFEKLLIDYFAQESLIESGLPHVGYFASRLNLSANYLSDMLHRFTGKTTQEHIHLALIEQAKNQLLGSGKSISEVAYHLGFDHPSHFTKLFKLKTGYSPSKYRDLN
jgi:AraC family transcriptional activator of pobA